MKKIICFFKKYVLLVLVSSGQLTFGNQEVVRESHLTMLLNDMKLYKLDSEGDLYLHAGDLYEHSLWVHDAMAELLESNSIFVQGLYLSPRMKHVVLLAALLHDIGKAGRKELFDRTHSKLHYDVVKNDDETVKNVTYYQDRKEHPCVSFGYTAHPLIPESHHERRAEYQIMKQDGTLVDLHIADLYAELGLSRDEQQIVAILTGIHYEFGMVREGKISEHTFLELLTQLIEAVQYNEGKLDWQIVQLAILINVADIKGLVPVAYTESSSFLGAHECPAAVHVAKIEQPFETWGYNSEQAGVDVQQLAGVRAYKGVMEYWMNQYEKSEEDASTPSMSCVGSYA